MKTQKKKTAKKLNENKLTRIISFRVSDAIYQKLNLTTNRSELAKSEILRQILSQILNK